ncbi:MAG TPA: hypothetical protein VGR12_07980 [Solirubrobacteraceae bacterium]|nr:hypothetical protein [Solirubrobacteraceae bacterium]
MTLSLPPKRWSLPPKRWSLSLVFVPLWLVLWTVGWIASGNQQLLIAGPIGTVLVAALYAWLVAGREEVEVEGRTLTLRRRVGPITHERRFDEPRDVRVLRDGGASIAFEHGGRTYRFAGALDEDEAQRVARQLTEALR